MSETLNTGIFTGRSNVLQNNSSVFEMRAKKGRILIPIGFLLVVLGYGFFSFLMENGTDFNYREAGTEIVGIIQETYGSVEIPGYVLPVVGVYLLIIIASIAFKSRRPSYIRIDQTQMIIKSALEYRFDNPGQNYIIVRPAKISSLTKGTGKNKHVLIELTNADQTITKFKFYAQTFGGKALAELSLWVINFNKASSHKSRSF